MPFLTVDCSDNHQTWLPWVTNTGRLRCILLHAAAYNQVIGPSALKKHEVLCKRRSLVSEENAHLITQLIQTAQHIAPQKPADFCVEQQALVL
uniref:Uncharacterized protein n=1 Tax=Knipowitschia caucasica TaxID=637954 RepID=A0AAV2JMQ5_KNICA